MQVANSVRRFAKAIRHGNEKHQEWLLAAAEAFLKGEDIPSIPASPPKLLSEERARALFGE